jgi:HlyD family secretion protein
MRDWLVTRKRLALMAVVVAAGAVVVWWATRPAAGEWVVEASGTVEAREADLGFQAGGRLASLLAREGDVVVEGELIAELDAAELEARMAAAEAQLAVARAGLAELEAGARPEEVRQARAAEAVAREAVEDAARLLERVQVLEASGAVSRESLDKARTAHEVARAQLAQAREQTALVEGGPRSERVTAQRAAVRQAEAAVLQVEAALSHARILAPFGGVVTVRHRERGEAVGPGAPVVTVLDPSERWVRIYVREDAIGRVSLGQRAEIRSDSDRARVFGGRVTHIAGEAEFTPRNVQTAEERVKLVYAVRVSITDDPANVLKPGVPADVRLLTDAADG